MRAADASALVNASRELLGKNDPVGAERVLGPIMPRLKSDAEALHLMGLIKRTMGHLQEAERYLRSAVAYSLNDGGYYNDLAVVLQALGQRSEARPAPCASTWCAVYKRATISMARSVKRGRLWPPSQGRNPG
jgi:Flp pilus assembly protein TadD